MKKYIIFLLASSLMISLVIHSADYSKELEDILGSIDREQEINSEPADSQPEADIKPTPDVQPEVEPETEIALTPEVPKESPEDKPSFWKSLLANFTIVKRAQKIPADSRMMFEALRLLKEGKNTVIEDADPLMIPKSGLGISGAEVTFDEIDSEMISAEGRRSLITVYNNMGVIYPIHFVQKSVTPVFKQLVTWLKRLQFFFPSTRIYLDVPLVNQILNILFDNVISEIIKNSKENINLALGKLKGLKKRAVERTDRTTRDESSSDLFDLMTEDEDQEAKVPKKRSFWTWIFEFGTFIKDARKIPTEAKKMRANLDKLKKGKASIKDKARTIMVPEEGIGFSGRDVSCKSINAVGMNAKERLAWVLIYNNMTIAYANKFLKKSIMPLCHKVIKWLKELQGLWNLPKALIDLELVEQILRIISTKALGDIEINVMDNIRLALEHVEMERELSDSLGLSDREMAAPTPD